MMVDPVFMIREESSIACIELSKSIYDTLWISNIADQKLEEFYKHERFMIRIQAVHFITRLHNEVTRELINRKFT